MFGCLFRLAAVLVVCLGLFAGALWLATSRTAMPPAPTPAVAAHPVASPVPTAALSTADASASARRKLAAAERAVEAAPAGSHQTVSVTLTEAEVNAIAAPELANDRDFPLLQPSVQILPGKLVVNGLAAIGPATIPISVTGNVHVQDGIPKVTIQSVQASGIAAPQSMVDQLSAQLATSLRLTPADLPLTVRTVTLGDHSVTIAGVTK